jgi:Na+-driven multidrug efflux pump
VNVLSEAVGKDDRESARHYPASAFWALVAIGLVIGIVLIAVFP